MSERRVWLSSYSSYALLEDVMCNGRLLLPLRSNIVLLVQVAQKGQMRRTREVFLGRTGVGRACMSSTVALALTWVVSIGIRTLTIFLSVSSFFYRA